MKFVSERVSNGRGLKASAPFDVAFIEKLNFDPSNGSFTFEYAMRDFQAQFPARVGRAFFLAKPTNDGVFCWATLYIEGESEHIQEFLADYGDTYGELNCEVELTEAEGKKLLLYLLMNKKAQ